MKILYIDLSYGTEHLVLNPNRYGGGRMLPTYCRELMDDFYILAHHESFENITDKEKKQNCFSMTDEVTTFLRKGGALKNLIDDSKFDLIVTSNPDIWINTTKPTLSWSVGEISTLNPLNYNVLLHNKNNQRIQLTSNNQTLRTFDFVLGVPIPPFEEYKKEDIIVQVTNHYPQISTHIMAEWCLQNKIEFYFGGPIAGEYFNHLKPYFDTAYTKYLGVLREQDKIILLKKARYFSALVSHPLNEPLLSIKQALGYGCGILTTGFVPELIKNNYNGFILNSYDDVVNAWNYRNNIKQIDCYNTVKERYSVEKMVESFRAVCEEILK